MEDDLNNVSREVETLTGKSLNNSGFVYSNTTYYKYLYVCVAVFILLILLRPWFLYTKIKNEPDAFSFKKLFVYSVIISVFIIFVIKNYHFLDNWKFLTK